jgi:peroxiredoxin
MQKRTLSILAIAAILSVGCQSAAKSYQKQKAPAFTLTDTTGKKFSLSDFKGKVVFVDFWATWCPPCVMSSPEVEKMSNDYKNTPLVVLSLSLDDSEDTVRKFLKTHKISNRVAVAANTDVPEHYSVRGIPAFYLIDQNGFVVRAWEGFSPTMPSYWRKEIDQLLKN